MDRDRERRETPLRDRLVAELPGLRAFLSRRAASGRSLPDLDDLVQDVMARALRFEATFDGTRDLGPWLRTVARRVLADRLERRPPPSNDFVDPEVRGHDSVVAPRDEIRRALCRLSGEEQDVLLRFHGRGQSLREIACALSMPLGTVKSHLHRARRRLADAAASDPGGTES